MKDNYGAFLKYRGEYPVFKFTGYDYTLDERELKISYNFSIPSLADFHPEWRIPRLRKCDTYGDSLERLVFSLGMAELVSYYKCVCSPRIEIECASLDTSESAMWWSQLYRLGLGEFLYTNGIPTDKPTADIVSSGVVLPRVRALGADAADRTLIPIGGGKDSAVTCELLREKTDRYAFVINSRGATDETARAAGLADKTVKAVRTLDRNLLDLNARGFLNGHTPFSAVVAFSSVLAAYINGIGNVALSNESSANESTVAGSDVNHQYSKSFEFEKDFIEYEKKYIGCGVKYYSLLRPWTELHIASEFSRLRDYHGFFRSCNAGSKTNSWCGVCPKCLFVAVILSPFLSREEIINIFGRDILDDPALTETLEKLAGVLPEKPFECVGSRGEVNAALAAACERDGEMPYLLRYYRDSMPHTGDKISDYLSAYSDNAIPSHDLRALTLARCFDEKIGALVRGKRVLILGYGREGRSTYALLKRLGCAARIGIADMKTPDDAPCDAVLHTGEGYLDALDLYDIVFKSPGIVLPRDVSAYSAEITSQTEQFLDFYGKNTIGITGTKGKSTTSTLLYHVFKSAGVPCVLGGNIGIPPFEMTGGIAPEDTAVLELSCHQLENCRVSPRVSVLLNFYEDHLDHYGTYEKYTQAKRNIYRHAGGDSILIKSPEISAPDARGRVDDINTGILPFDDLCALGSRLHGEHNLYNCAAVLAAARTVAQISNGLFTEAVKSYEPLPHRLEYIGEVHGIRWYDDSISTTVQSAESAVRAIPGDVTLLVGGMDRGIDYSSLADFISRGEVKRVILMYESGERIREMLPAVITGVYTVRDLREAVALAKSITPPGDACVLSPAAASYGHFKNFEERGERFKKFVSGSV